MEHPGNALSSPVWRAGELTRHAFVVQRSGKDGGTFPRPWSTFPVKSTGFSWQWWVVLGAYVWHSFQNSWSQGGEIKINNLIRKYSDTDGADTGFANIVKSCFFCVFTSDQDIDTKSQIRLNLQKKKITSWRNKKRKLQLIGFNHESPPCGVYCYVHTTCKLPVLRPKTLERYHSVFVIISCTLPGICGNVFPIQNLIRQSCVKNAFNPCFSSRTCPRQVQGLQGVTLSHMICINQV